jgi:GNAT superfamily N-acetyltransferase
MNEAKIPDYNIFMMCQALDESALSVLPDGYYFRNCRSDDLEKWKAFPFDTEIVPEAYEAMMNQFIEDVYHKDMTTFFNNTLFVCNSSDTPIATCSYWKAHGQFNTIHWLKTTRLEEGKGLGRAILSEIMTRFRTDDYPIYLHTQVSSFRAIKLYADFGFKLLRGGKIGPRVNDLEKSLPILQACLPKKYYDQLEIIDTPNGFIQALSNETTIEF